MRTRPYYYIEAAPGTEITSVIADLCRTAARSDTKFILTFNGTRIDIYPDSLPSERIAFWHNERTKEIKPKEEKKSLFERIVAEERQFKEPSIRNQMCVLCEEIEKMSAEIERLKDNT